MRELNVPRGVPRGDGGDVTDMIGHPIVVCPAEVAAVCKGAHGEAAEVSRITAVAAGQVSSSTPVAAGSGRGHVDKDGDVAG